MLQKLLLRLQKLKGNIQKAEEEKIKFQSYHSASSTDNYPPEPKSSPSEDSSSLSVSVLNYSSFSSLAVDLKMSSCKQQSVESQLTSQMTDPKHRSTLKAQK